MMRLAILVDGEFDKVAIEAAAREFKATRHLYPDGYDLDLPRSTTLLLDHKYGEEAPYELVFRLLNRSDALLLFAHRIDRGIAYAALRKARQYSMPVTTIRIDEDGKEYRDTTGPDQKAVTVERQERVSYSRRRESKIAAACAAQAA